MTLRRRNPDLICRGLILAALLLGNSTRAQNVILHLRNGDRLAGTILSESTHEVRMSNVWSKGMGVPVSQIERRETPMAGGDTAAARIAAGLPNSRLAPAAHSL